MDHSTQQLPQYAPELKELFKQYREDKLTRVQLVEKLRTLERKMRRELGDRARDENLWFRFFPGATIATTIDNVDRGLDPQREWRGNIDFMHECMDICVNESDPVVYFS